MNYIPGPDNKFDAFFSNVHTILISKTSGQTPEWNHIPDTNVQQFSTFYSIWSTAYEKTKGPHTSVDTEGKREARKAAEAYIREFVQRFLYWDPVTNADRTAMKLHNRDKTYTNQPAPTIHVGFSLEIHAIYQIKVRLWVLETNEARIPYNMNGVVVYTLVSDTPITNQEDLRTTRLVTKHIDVLSFPPEARGKTVYVACRWENAKGEEGEWSPIQSIVIP
jgi:hypothetical protein